jgi:hypothetical protein
LIIKLSSEAAIKEKDEIVEEINANAVPVS